MATLTLRLPASQERAAPSRRPGFWRRAFNAAVEARMRQAEAEIARHLPVDRRPHNDRIDVGALPFVR